MRTMGSRHPFKEQPWEEIHDSMAWMADRHPSMRHMAELTGSVISSLATELLAGCKSMHDLIVVPRPIPEPPYDVIAVRAAGSLMHPPRGFVLIEHLTVMGRNERIERPVAETVPLFWRFTLEKFGIHPPRS